MNSYQNLNCISYLTCQSCSFPTPVTSGDGSAMDVEVSTKAYVDADVVPHVVLIVEIHSYNRAIIPMTSILEWQSPTVSKPSSRPAGARKTFRIDDVPDEEKEGVEAKYIPSLALVKEGELAAKKARTYGAMKGIYDCCPFKEYDFTLHTSANTFKKADGHIRMHARDAPLSVILDGQKHRHVDQVLVNDSGALKNFTAAWVNKGMAEQCVVWLYGHYSDYDAFEDGIRAEVQAVYEPPQMGSVETVTLLQDPTNEHVERVARMLGMIRVGWAITGGARDFKGLSSGELAAACRFQQVTRINNSPMSRFVTVLMQPQEDGTVEPTMWQATDQAVALHRDKILQKPNKAEFCRCAFHLGKLKMF